MEKVHRICDQHLSMAERIVYNVAQDDQLKRMQRITQKAVP
jgi:hypothetical protein